MTKKEFDENNKEQINWKKEEDERIINYVRINGDGSWNLLPFISKTKTQIREKWVNYLQFNTNASSWAQKKRKIY